MLKTYLITGGAGFIGSNFIHFLFEKYGSSIRIINLDKLTYAGNLNNLEAVKDNPNYTFIKGDICDESAVENIFKKYEIDYVINFAAESHVDRSILSSKEFIVTNILGTQNLLDIAKRHWTSGSSYKAGKKFLQVSTDEVYGSLGASGLFTEQTPLDPHSPYSASKTGADLLVQAYCDTHKFPANITRCSNNYGAYQFPEKLIPLIISNCIMHKSLPVYGDGMNVRDWLYVKDHCSAIDLVINFAENGKIYNVGGFNEKTNIFIVKTIIKILNETYDKTITEGLITYVEDRKGHDRRYAIDSSKITKELGWKPAVNFEEGIKKTISWYLKNQKWLDDIRSGKYKTEV